MEMRMAAAFVLDRASILERLGGDEEIYAMMVDMFVADVENNCTALAPASTCSIDAGHALSRRLSPQ